MKKHLYWIDWMKVIGMYFIIAGHIFPMGHEYIYVFSVPLFFVISGYLGHVENSSKLFWQKSFKNLILPCVIILLILHAEQILAQIRIGTFAWINIPTHIFNCLIGSLALHTDAGGIGICWFIYTLVLCKIIQQYISQNRIANAIVIVVCLIAAMFYNYNDLHLRNAYINSTLAYPFYAMGGGIKCLNIDSVSKKPWVIAVATIVSIVLVFVVGWYNGAPWMFDATYGKNIFLFFIGGLAGTFSVFSISYFFRNIKPRPLVELSKGTIIILGFHQLFIRAYDYLPNQYHTVIIDYIVALFILLAFIPIIRLSEKYFPVLLGSRAIKQK